MSNYKTALVTGASAGFGFEIAKALAESGFKDKSREYLSCVYGCY